MERISRLAPGLALVAAIVGAGILLNRAVPQVSALIFAMGLGVLFSGACSASSHRSQS